MPFGRTFAGQMLEHILNNADIPNIGNAGGLLQSSVDGNLYIALHTADPGATGTQATSECAYTGYARVAAVRDGTFWTVVAPAASPNLDVTFPASTSGPETATHVTVGVASAGATVALLRGTVTPNIIINNGTTPIIDGGSTITFLET